jgi:hypothetical protein
MKPSFQCRWRFKEKEVFKTIVHQNELYLLLWQNIQKLCMGRSPQ